MPLKDHTPEDLAHTITLEMAQVHGRDSHAADTVESAILLAWHAHDGPALGDAAGDNPGEIELLERRTSVGGRLSLVDGFSEGSLPETGDWNQRSWRHAAELDSGLHAKLQL
ncbi:hypothetical protein ABLG96_10270 [Nakamurella sp. A5-74]|uniref:DUF222 domain-containing protein n=1 Tax=Nakamurella sp. A5-74 TaxID=3158264 RepID=A0AAU8DTS2_9ACTN